MVLDKKVCHSCKSVDFWIGEIGGAPMLQRLKHHLVQSCAKLQHTDSFTRLSLMLHNPRTLQLSYSPPRKLLIMWIQFISSVRSSSGYHGLIEIRNPLFQIFQILQILK